MRHGRQGTLFVGYPLAARNVFSMGYIMRVHLLPLAQHSLPICFSVNSLRICVLVGTYSKMPPGAFVVNAAR